MEQKVATFLDWLRPQVNRISSGCIKALSVYFCGVEFPHCPYALAGTSYVEHCATVCHYVERSCQLDASTPIILECREEAAHRSEHGRCFTSGAADDSLRLPLDQLGGPGVGPGPIVPTLLFSTIIWIALSVHYGGFAFAGRQDRVA